MNVALVNEVKSELARLSKAIIALDDEKQWYMDTDDARYETGPRTAAVKRASMDVTRVLARLRRVS